MSPVWSARTGPGLPAHVATTRHLCAAYPLVAEAGLGHRGVLIGRDVLGGSFVYDPFALYRAGEGSLERLSGYRAVKPGEIPAIVRTPCVCFGTGARLAEEFLAGMEGVTLIKDAFSAVSGERLIREALGRAAHGSAEEPQPIYGRRSEAEIKFNVAVT